MPDSILELVGRGDIVVDAGANVGLVTAQLCNRVGPSGTVLAIEPLPANAQRLREFAEDNDLPQLQVAEVALSDRPGTAELRCEDRENTSPYASFSASWIDGSKIAVETRTLDEVAPGSVSLIKLDVEGAESLVLNGASRVLLERPMIYCEFNDIVLRDSGSSAEQLLEHFARLGYGPRGRLDGSVADVLMIPKGHARI